MSLILTPETLAAGYDFLRSTRPFKGWRLPHSDDIEFRVTREGGEMGHYNRYAGTDHHWIAMSEKNLAHTNSLLMFLGHEMIHLKQAIAKTETKNTQHNAEFHRLARNVCRAHGFDPKMFV